MLMELYLKLKKKAICGVQMSNDYICQDCISNSLLCSHVNFDYFSRSYIF